MTWRRVAVGLAALAACSQPPAPGPKPLRAPPEPKRGTVTISIVGTNDLHGALDRLPVFAGFVANLRAARAADRGGVVLLDAGDMFQGTLESNLAEGADVVRAYNQLGYTAAAVGNHEFDYGPAGPAATPTSIEDDARGALKARAAEAKFPLIATNILDQTTKSRIKWPNMPSSALVEVAGIKIGIIGLTTESTPFTTMPVNFAGLAIAPPAAAAAQEARLLREQGAQIVLVTAHLGSRCQKLEDPNDLSSCETNEELFRMISDLPSGAIDVIVAGHTHAGIAHRVSGIAVIESYASGRAFGRVDLRVAADGHVTSVKIHKPYNVCPGETMADCTPGDYEGRPVAPDPAVKAIVDDALARSRTLRNEKLGVTLAGVITKSYGTESAEGNWFTDLMLAARPEAQVALTNGGGLRADIPAGELTYGQLFEANPFDNRFALVDLKGSHLRKLVSTNLQRGGAILSWSGLAAKARCNGGKLDVHITVAGKPISDAGSYKLVTSDFLASGGDGLIGRLKLPEGSVKITDVIIRDAMADVLRKTRGAKAKIDPASYHSPTRKRMDYEGDRPVNCGMKTPPPSNREPED